jgi:predicted membrane channel-forming protein YqfA (hemolysin III family)
MNMTSKKVVRVDRAKADQAGGASWRPTPEAKGQATTHRVIALLLWALAIAGEVFAIFYVLKQPTINMVMLIGAIVVIGVLAVIGDLLWKKANRLDPASKADTIRFFVQNQLGAIIALVAFLPLIVLILTNKNMDSKQKGIATAVGVVAMAIAAIMGVSFNPPSVEQYTVDTAEVVKLTGRDLVFWTKEGNVYHLCQAASDLQRESKDNTIYSGRVADARAASKERLTLKVEQEMRECGYSTPVPATPAPSK